MMPTAHQQMNPLAHPIKEQAARTARRAQKARATVKRPMKSAKPTKGRAARKPGLRAAFDGFVRRNPRGARAVLMVLEMVAESDLRRAMRLIEAVTMVVATSGVAGDR